MRKFETKTASWSRHRRQNFLVRLVSLTLCFALFVSSTGMAMIGEDAKTQQDAELTTVSDVVPGSDETGAGDTGAGDGSDVLPGDTGTGDAGENPGGTGENPGETPENPGDGPVDPGTGPDDNLPEDNSAEIAAALERFNIALDAFRAGYTYELSNHGIDGHVCRWGQFEDALNLATAVKTSVSELIANDAAVLAGLDETNAMLSVCAAGAYESRAAAVLARTDYTGMTQFDADVARVDSLLKYMLDAELNSSVITGLRADLTQMRVDLAAALEGGSGGTGEPENPENPDNPDNPDNPENPDADAILAIAAAYEALNTGWQAMSFDAVLAEIDRIQAMISGLTDAGKADINVVTVGEYLLTIQSAAAVQELGARVAALQIESLDAPGLADRIAEAKTLTGYMTAGDMADEAVTGHLAALDAILEALNAPVVLDAGKKFVADVGALKGSFDASRLHAMSKQVSGLRTSYDALVEADKADASVIAALAELDAMQAQCDGLDGNIKAFLMACDALFDAYAQVGFDITSESAKALGQAVADAFAVLDESSFDNVEVVEYYTRLEAAGLLPKDDIAAQIDFQVKMNRLDSLKAVEAYSAGLNNAVQVFKLEHNSTTSMGAGDVEYSDDYFRSYAILGLDAQDVNGNPLALDFAVTATGSTNWVHGEYIQQVYASTKSYDEIDELVTQIARTDFATATYTMEDLLAEHFVEIIGDAAAPAGAQCYIVAYDVDAQGANVSAYCDISVCIGGADWMVAAPGTSVGYKFRGVTEPGNRVTNPDDVNGVGTWQYNRVAGVEGDCVFVDDEVLSRDVVRLVARELSGVLTDENGIGMGDIALALFTYDAGTDAYTRLERDISGNRIGEILTAGDGSYLFDKLPAGDYYIAMRGATLNNKAAGTGMIKVTDRMHGLDGWTFVSEGATSFKTLRQFETDILLGSNEYVDLKTWGGQFEAGLPPYEVFVTWMDGQPGATLSEDKTHADWVIDSAKAASSFGKDFLVEFVIHEDLPAGTQLLTIPRVLCSYDIDLSKFDFVADVSGISASYSSVFDGGVATTIFSSIDSLTLSSSPDEYRVTVDGQILSGTRVSIPLSAYWQVNCVDDNGSYRSRTACPVDGPDVLTYLFDAESLGSRALTMCRYVGIKSLSIEPVVGRNGYKNDVHPSGNTGSRVFSWSPLVESAYGVSKDLFDSLISSNKVVLEFHYSVNLSASVFGFLDYLFTPMNGGLVIGSLENTSNRALSDNLFSLKLSDYFVGDSSLSSPFPYGSLYYKDVGNNNSVGSFLNANENVYSNLLRGARGANAPEVPVVSVLVAYNVDDIVDVSKGIVTAGCAVNVSWRSPFDDKTLSASVDSVLTAPYTEVISEGSQYSLSFGPEPLKFPSVGDNISNLYFGRYINAQTVVNAVCKPRVLSDGTHLSDNIGFAVDSLGVFSNDKLSVSTLGSTDYAVQTISLSGSVGVPYYSDTGAIIAWSLDESCYDDAIKVYVCCSDAPSDWVYDSSVCWRDVVNNKCSIALSHDDVIRVRFDYEDCTSAFSLSATVHFRIFYNGLNISRILSEIREQELNASKYLYCGVSAALFAYDADKSLLINRSLDDVRGAWRDDLAALSISLYAPIGYVDGAYPLRIVGYGSTVSWLGQYPVYVRTDFLNHDTSAVISVASELRSLSANNYDKDCWDLDALTELDVFDMHTAEFLVLLPDSVEVTNISPGMFPTANDNTAVVSFCEYCSNGGRSIFLTKAYGAMPSLDYSVDESIKVPGFVAYRIVSTFEFDRRAYTRQALSSKGADLVLPFGHFHIDVQPKYTERFLTDDTEVYVLSYVVDTRSSTHDAYADGLLWQMYPDSGSYWFSGAYRDALHDLDGDGDTDERVIGQVHHITVTNNPVSYTSGLQLKAQGSSSRLFNTATTTSPTDPYRYKMTYQQAIEPSTNVVMYNSIEDISGNTWGGTLQAIDMSDADRQGIGYVIYGNASRIDSLNYVQSKFNHENLRALEDGWFVIDNNTDLSTVKSIAIDFGGHEFQRDENNKPATVSVVYTMTPPAGGFAAGQTSIGNRAFFSDTLKGSGTTRTVMANQVTVTMDTEVGGGISKTIAPVVNDSDDGDTDGEPVGTWVDEYDEAGNKITLDKTGKPVDPYMYTYHLKYTMDDPGAGNYNGVSNVILYDNLENGTDSKYAGRLTNIGVTGSSAVLIQNPVDPDNPDEPGVPDDLSISTMSLLPDNTNTNYIRFSADGGPGVGIRYFVNYEGMSVTTDLPDGLVETTGVTDWEELSCSSPSSVDVPEGANIRHIAVVVSDLVTMHESGLNSLPYQDSYIDVALTMEHAGRMDCFGNDKIIRNGMLVSYQVPGVDDPVVVTLPEDQQPELEVIYRDTGFALPVTGGSGWFIPTVSGIGCIVLAASWIMSERKWRRRMAAVMAQQAGSEHDNQ